MNAQQRARMLELDLVAKRAEAAQLEFAQEVYPKGCMVRAHHSRGAFDALVVRHNSDGHQLRVKNCRTGKQSYAYPSASRTAIWRGEKWETYVECLEGPNDE